jgi:hypothetical protein
MIIKFNQKTKKNRIFTEDSLSFIQPAVIITKGRIKREIKFSDILGIARLTKTSEGIDAKINFDDWWETPDSYRIGVEGFGLVRKGKVINYTIRNLFIISKKKVKFNGF